MKEDALLDMVAVIAKECTPERVTRLERMVCTLIKANATPLPHQIAPLVERARAILAEMDSIPTAIKKCLHGKPLVDDCADCGSVTGFDDYRVIKR